MKKNKNLEFLGFFERCDRLITFWFRFQVIPVFIFYVVWPFCFIGKFKNNALYVWLVQAVLLLIIAIIGLFKAKTLSRIFSKAVKIVSKHPNKNLVKIFSGVPGIIKTILVLEILLPLIWPFSFPLKFHFYKNINMIKSLIAEYKKLD